MKKLSQHSKPWWKWVNKTDLAILRCEKASRLRRNSITLTKARLDNRRPSILRKSSLNRVVEGDYCVGGRRHDEEHPGKQPDDTTVVKTPNTDALNGNECDYRYEGYTLEIADKVRIVNIFKDKKEQDVEDISAARIADSENDMSKTPDDRTSVKPKAPKRVQFWGLARD